MTNRRAKGVGYKGLLIGWYFNHKMVGGNNGGGGGGGGWWRSLKWGSESGKDT